MLLIGIIFDFNKNEYKITDVHVNIIIGRSSMNNEIEFMHLKFVLITYEEKIE